MSERDQPKALDAAAALPAHCPSCGAPIIWATDSTGARMALDREPVEGGNLRVHRDGPIGEIAWPGGSDPEFMALGWRCARSRSDIGRRHQSHFASCPDAAAENGLLRETFDELLLRARIANLEAAHNAERAAYDANVRAEVAAQVADAAAEAREDRWMRDG